MPPATRILVIDDDTELSQLVADYLKPMGFEVECEHEGNSGAERATNEPWHAIILDVMMPGCDGFEVLRRIRTKSKLRRSGWVAETSPQAPMKEIVVGPLRINADSHAVVLGDAPLDLTPAEFGLLLSLAKAHGRVRTREQLIEDVADREWDVFDRAIDMHISMLRRKLGDDPKNPQFIKTVRGYGYQLVTPSR